MTVHSILAPPNPLGDLIAAAMPTDGLRAGPYPGTWLHRSAAKTSFSKWYAFGPSLTLVAQGTKVSKHQGVSLEYDPAHYFVATGEAQFDATVTEASVERPFLSVCFQIPSELVAKTLLALADASVPEIPETTPAYVAPIDPSIVDCMVRMLRASVDPVERALIAPLVAEELVLRLLRSDAAAAVRSAVENDRDSDKIASAMRFLRENLERPVSVDDVARHVRMSPSHFAHRFRAIARVSPMRYLKNLRLGHARTLLVSHGARVSEAAARAGYESTSHFTRDFKLSYGSSPAEYARQFRAPS